MGPRSGNAFLRAFTVGTDDLFSTDGFDGVGRQLFKLRAKPVRHENYFDNNGLSVKRIALVAPVAQPKFAIAQLLCAAQQLGRHA